MKLRAGLHYGGEVHRLVKGFSPRYGYLRQRMVCRRRWKDNREDNKICLSSRSSPEVSCPRLWGCPRKLTFGDLLFLKSVRQVGILVIFSIHVQCSPPKDSWPFVNHHRTRVLLSANQILEFPWNSPWKFILIFMIGGLLHRSVNQPLYCCDFAGVVSIYGTMKL